MTTLILNIDNEELLQKAKKFAEENKLIPQIINEDDLENIHLLKMIKEGQTGEFVDNNEFINSLGNQIQNR